MMARYGTGNILFIQPPAEIDREEAGRGEEGVSICNYRALRLQSRRATARVVELGSSGKIAASSPVRLPTIMKHTLALCVLLTLCACRTTQRPDLPPAHTPAALSEEQLVQNRSGLVAKVGGHVKVLRFSTDRPVSSVRLVIDGNIVSSEEFHSTQNGFDLAVITPLMRESKVEVYFDVSGGGMGSHMQGDFRQVLEDNVMIDEYFGPGTNVTIPDWTTVYSVKQHYLGTINPLYQMKVEIK